jgi:hypothetical protein
MARQPKKGVTQTDIPAPAAEAAVEAAPPKAARKTTAAKASASAAENTPAARKAAPRKTAATAGTGTKASAKMATKASEVTPEQRYRMVQDAAYYIAERNGFVGDNHAYWLEAEQAIDAQLAGR